MYESYYGFSAKPFQLNPDPAFYYGSRGHRRAMAYLEYGLHQNEGFIVITGDVGAGKTTLVRSLLQRLEESRVVAAHLVSTQIDADDILRMVAGAFGIPCRGMQKSDLLLALEGFLVSITAAGKRALLIVDEAQNLTPRAVEELRMLSNFQLEDHALLQSFLVGQPEFRETMQSPHMQQLRQRVIASYHLGPMDAEETRAYIEHRLKHVGWVGDPRFESDSYSSIYVFSEGVPRRINTLCDRLLLASFLAERKTVTDVHVDEVVREIQDEVSSATCAVRRSCPSEKMAGLGLPGQVVDLVSIKNAVLELGSLAEDSDLLRSLSDAAAGFHVSRLEDRISKLETSFAVILSLLEKALRANSAASSDSSAPQA